MGDRERRLDALTAKVTKLLAPPATHDGLGHPLASRDYLHIDVVPCPGACSQEEWEAEAMELELHNRALLCSRYAHDAFAAVEGTLGTVARDVPQGLTVTMSYEPWEPGPPAWTPEPVEPPPLPRPPIPRRSEPEPAALIPGSGPEHVWPRWF